MSEYQYYEFATIDRPLTRAEMAELRAVSTRAEITPAGFVNHYEWGDPKADPADWTMSDSTEAGRAGARASTVYGVSA